MDRQDSITIQNGLTGNAKGLSGTVDNKTNGIGVANAQNTTSPYFDINASSGTVNSMDMYYPKTLVDARVTEETIELKYIRRARYSLTQTTFTIAGGYTVHTPDLAIKEIYGVMDGKLTLLKTVTGRVVPPQEIPETLQFDDEIDE